jgi:hypothetical protein
MLRILVKSHAPEWDCQSFQRLNSLFHEFCFLAMFVTRENVYELLLKTQFHSISAHAGK